MILAGIDEAGYGPTLGPLVVSVSVFRVPDANRLQPEGTNLWSLLESAVCRKKDGHRIAVNDSKRLFHQKKGLRDLEEGLLPFFCLKGEPLPRDLRSLLGRVARQGVPGSAGAARDPAAYLERYPWYKGRNVELPTASFANFLLTRAGQLEGALEAAGVECLGLAACPFEVFEFNQQIEKERNKARVSFQAVGSFLERLWKKFPGEAVEATVDRQGGRTHYGPSLFEWIHPRGIRIETQSEEMSAYQLTRKRGAGQAKTTESEEAATFRVVFGIDSESHSLPVALASMLSKYLREVHMILFNSFWRELSADLKPTAGYATDAR